jgi:L-threonylcarbamoyladenylate synthase
MRKFDTKVLKIDPSTISFDKQTNELIITDEHTKQVLQEAAELLQSSQVVGFPTETVYGLGASSLSSDAVRRIYEAKNRPADNPLISHISSVDMITDLFKTKIPEVYKPLIAKFWPGPLSIVLPVSEGCPVSPVVTAGQNTFAVRFPENKVARALIQVSNLPLAAPSANASTRPSPTLASHVYEDLQGKIPMIIDGGQCDVGLESTVVDGTVDPPMLLRPGGISLEEIRKLGGSWTNIVLGKKTAGQYEKVRTPGMKYKHYSPTAKVILFENFNNAIDAVNFYTNTVGDNLNGKKYAVVRSKYWTKTPEDASLILDLGKTGDDIQRNLFAALRDSDAQNVDIIFVEGVSEEDEGLAIMNRLSKAASQIFDKEAI